MVYTIKINGKTFKTINKSHAINLYVKETLLNCNTIEEIEKAKDNLIANCESILIDIGMGKSNKSHFTRVVNERVKHRIIMLNAK